MNTNSRPGCLTSLLETLSLRRKQAPDAEEPASFAYKLADAFLFPAELSFYQVLRQAVGDCAVICPKMGLGDLFYSDTGDRSQNAAYRNRIDRKHVDFLLCEPGTLKPLLGIELDDASHQRPDRVERDTFVEQVFWAAGLPLLRVPVQTAYAPLDLADRLRHAGLVAASAGAAAADSASQTAAVAPAAPAAPLCPKCNVSMVLRTVKKQGPYYGRQFYGCPNYPQCREVAPLREPEPANSEGQ